MNRKKEWRWIWGFIGMVWIVAMGTWVMADERQGWHILACNPLLSSLEMESTWAAAKAIGVEGIEINVSPDLICSSLYVGKETPYAMDTMEHAKKVRADAQANGLLTPVICAPIQLDEKSEKAVAPQWAITLIRNASSAGVHLIYFPIGTRSLTPSAENDVQFIQRSTALLKDLAETGAKNGITIVFENLGVFWNRPEITQPVLDAFASDQINLCLDPINLYWYGYPRSRVYKLVRHYIPRAKYFHVKNVAHPEDQREATRTPGWQYGENSVPVAEGDLDFKQILTWLHDSGYRGEISIEDDSLGHYPVEKRVEILKQDVQYLEKIRENL